MLPVLFSDFQHGILNGIHTGYPQFYTFTQLPLKSITTNIPDPDVQLESHPENNSTTEIPTANSSENTHHTDNRPADTDQTFLKVLDTDQAPPDVQSEKLSHPSPGDRQDTIPKSRDSLSNTPSSRSEGSLHRIPLHRAQRAPTTFISMPSLDEETSFITPEPASPDSVVTEVIVTTATPDNTTKSSITRSKWNGRLYRRDVNQPEDDEAAMAIQAVNNIPREFGIEVRENPHESLVP